MSLRTASVLDVTNLSPRLRRIRLQVDDIAGLDVKPAGDSAVGVYFAPPDPDDATGGQDADGRNYTVRHRDGDVLTLDVVLHARGPGTQWARRTRPGDRVGLDHARSWYRPPRDADWILLAADLSGLPAAARIAEELPAGSTATLILAVAETADLDYLPALPGVELQPLVGSGNGRGESVLGHRVAGLHLPAGRGYCWFAGEAGQARIVRKHLRGQGWTIDDLDVVGYWRADSETWDARFALIETEALAVYDAALAAGRGDRVASEEFDDALERLGL